MYIRRPVAKTIFYWYRSSTLVGIGAILLIDKPLTLVFFKLIQL